MADFRIGDYDYTIIDADNNYVKAKTWDRNKVQYEVLHSIIEYNGTMYTLTSMAECFMNCSNFNQLITIPNSVTNMSYCFYNCISFKSSVTFEENSQVTDMNHCFYDCTSFNQSITIPKLVTDISFCFYDCTFFNSLVTFEENSQVTDMNHCFYWCESFNQSIEIPNLVTDMSYCFTGCISFNKPVTIPDSVTNMSYCFRGCTSFNKPIEIPDSVTNMYYCFKSCTSFDKPITIPDSVTDMGYCFDACSSFDSQVTFEENSQVTSMNCCFMNCTSFDKPITIPDSVTSMSSCFAGCTSFNQPIEIPDSVTSMSSCFAGCTSFNQPIEIPDLVTSMSSCFAGCTSFNQPIEIPDLVTSMSSCFHNCASFNQPIEIPNLVTNMSNCFHNCASFNQPIEIPNLVTNMSWCFTKCTSLEGNIICFNKPNSYSSIFNNTIEDINIIAIGDDNYSTWQTIVNYSNNDNSNNNIHIPNNFEFEYGDYKYTGVDSGSQNYIQVRVIDKTKVEYGEILSTYINNRKVTDISYCFEDCTSFNQSLTIPNSVTNMECCFINCHNFNKTITILGPVTNMGSCFYNCYSFNKPITIPNSVINMSGCFLNCTSFNSEVIFGNSPQVTNMSLCFMYCTSFNQSITIPSSVEYMTRCFFNCISLIEVPNLNNAFSVIDMNRCFEGCTSLTSSPFIPNIVSNMYRCFANCTSLINPPIIPYLVQDLHQCFLNCTSLASNISVYNSNITDSAGIFDGTTNDIYIINGQHGQSSQDAVAQTWRAIAANYVKVYYELDKHQETLNLILECERVDDNSQPSSLSSKIKLERDYTPVSGDNRYLPYGWANSYLPVNVTEEIFKDSDYTTNIIQITNPFTIQSDEEKHAFTYRVSYSINGRNVLKSIVTTVTRVMAILDFLGKGNQGGYIDEPGMGAAIGTVAKRDGLEIKFPTTIGIGLKPADKEVYKKAEGEFDSEKTYYIETINGYEVVTNPVAEDIDDYYEKLDGVAVDLDNYQLIVGRYNKKDNDKAFIIGNGTGDEAANRSNALTVDRNGNVEISGYITIDSIQGIKYKGTKATTSLINFLDNKASEWGNGVSVGNGGLAMLAAGESYGALINEGEYNAGDETAVVASDSEIHLWTNLQNGLSSGKKSIIRNNGNIEAAGILVSASDAYEKKSYFGCQNASYCHIYTDAPQFAFNKAISMTAGGIGTSDYPCDNSYLKQGAYFYAKRSGSNQILAGTSSAGDAFFGYGFYANSVGHTYFDGNIVHIRAKQTIDSNKAITNVSDKRFKIDRKFLDETINKLLLSLKPFEFKWDNKVDGYEDSKKIIFGLGAQDVEEAMNDVGLNPKDYNLVGQPEKGYDKYTLSYTEFIPMIIHLCQTQQKEIDSLKNEISFLKTNINK